MNEIPELPARAPLSRPPVPGGLERAMRDGRRRRNRFLGAAGGTSTALVLVAALALAAPAEENDSLRVADPEPSSSASAEAAPPQAPEPEPSPRADPQDEPRPTPSAEDGTGEDGAQEAAPEVEPQAEPQDERPVQESREPYVEEPRDLAAPAVCQGTPQQIDPVVTSASGCFSGGPTTSDAPQGGQVLGTFSYCVPYQEEDLELSYDDGREHEVRVHSGTESGPVVWTFSDTVTYPQGPHVRTIRSGRCLEWTGVWDTTLADGSDAPPGEYYVFVTAVPDVVAGHPTREGEGGGVGFPVTITEG